MSAALTSDQVVDFLRTPDAYPDKPRQVEVVETHISWVFLTNSHAYKLKKPVRFDFLDFSTLAKRKHACCEELRLNRRLAPHVYLGLTPVTLNSRGQLKLGEGGEVVDWLVKMQRLRHEQAMDQLALARLLERQQADHLAERLIDFYDNLPPLTMFSCEYRQRFERHVADNRRVLMEQAPPALRPLIKQAQQAQVRFLRLGAEALDDRVCDGRIVEGHGDLRPEHVYFAPSPVVIDCIEFNPEYRQIDVLDELGFFAMECDLLGADWAGERVLARYRQSCRDEYPLSLLLFYKCYRACVRAKVSLLSHAQHQEETEALRRAVAYLHLAAQYAKAMGKRVLIILSGESGSGKTTLAGEFARMLDIDHLQTDRVRRQMFAEGGAEEGYAQGKYGPEQRRAVYEELLRQADNLLGQGLSVVLDGSFLKSEQRQAAAALARRHNAAALLVRCRCSPDIARHKISERGGQGLSLSDARPEFVALQTHEEEPSPPELSVFEADTTESPEVVCRQALEQLDLSQQPMHVPANLHAARASQAT